MAEVDKEVLKKITELVEQIQFGTITIVVHEGKIVQLDTTTKMRVSNK